MAAHKSDRRTVRGLEQLLAAVVVEEVVGVVAAAAAAAWTKEVEPGDWAPRAGTAAASPGTG